VDPCQINFAKRDDFLCFLNEHNHACLKVAEQFERQVQLRLPRNPCLGACALCGDKLAALLLEWWVNNGEATKAEPPVKLRITHEEIPQRVGTSRETVSRLLVDLKEATNPANRCLNPADSEEVGAESDGHHSVADRGQ
jgi:CRP/FNR family transcriptional regulator, cyclic AMP receptor protein